MKIRDGFVSNSSSSSFMVVGRSFSLPKNQDLDELSYDSPKDILLALGLEPINDEELQVIHRYDDNENVVVGFGDQDFSEYDWNDTSISTLEQWTKKARDYLGGEMVQVWHGIVNPGH